MSHHSRTAIVAIIAALSLVPAASAAGRPAPGTFVAKLYQWALNGEGDRLYNALVPQQRHLINRAAIDTCATRVAARQTSAVTITNWKTLDQLPVTITIPGTKTKLKTVAVTVRLKASDGSSGVQTSHLVGTRTGWEWMVDGASLAKYRAGRCPS